MSRFSIQEIQQATKDNEDATTLNTWDALVNLLHTFRVIDLNDEFYIKTRITTDDIIKLWENHGRRTYISDR
jgi:predicted nucleotidyltransferase